MRIISHQEAGVTIGRPESIPLEAAPSTDEEQFNLRYPEYFHTMQPVIEIPGDPSIHLRHIDYVDAVGLVQVIENNRNNFAEYLNWTAKADVTTMLNRIEHQLYLSSCEEGMAYCIVQGTSDDPRELIGSIRLFSRYPSWRTNGTFDIRGPVVHSGSWIEEHARGQGVMLRVRRALYQYAQHRWGIENILLDIATNNVAAECSARAIGAVPMNVSYWQTVDTFEYEALDMMLIEPSCCYDMGLRVDNYYKQKRAVERVPMQKWLLRLV